MNDDIRKLYIEPTSRCNLNCVMCFRHSWVGEEFGDMSMEVFRSAIGDREALKNCETVFFGGMGEPLVHPRIIDMVREAAAAGFRTEMITNGLLLNEELCVDLIDAGLSALWISVEGFDEENYEKIQVGGRFRRVVEGIRALNRVRGRSDGAGSGRADGSLKLGIGFILMRSNLGQLREMERFAEEMGADMVNLSHMIPNTEEDRAETLWEMTARAQERDAEFILDSEEALRDPWGYLMRLNEGLKPSEGAPESARFRFLRDDLSDLFGERVPREIFSRRLEVMWKGEVIMRRPGRCRFIEEGNCFIRWDGDVTPCMGLLHSGRTFIRDTDRIVWHQSFGDLNTQRLSTAWNDPAYSEFRERVRRFNFSPCTECGGCELRESNQEDCLGNEAPTCGACLWGQDLIRCP